MFTKDLLCTHSIYRDEDILIVKLRDFGSIVYIDHDRVTSPSVNTFSAVGTHVCQGHHKPDAHISHAWPVPSKSYRAQFVLAIHRGSMCVYRTNSKHV